MIKLFEYLDAHGRSLFEAWFESLEARAATKVVIATEKLVKAISATSNPWDPVFQSIALTTAPDIESILRKTATA